MEDKDDAPGSKAGETRRGGGEEAKEVSTEAPTAKGKGKRGKKLRQSYN